MISVTGVWCLSGRVRQCNFFVNIYVDSTIYGYFEQHLQHICLTNCVCSCNHFVASWLISNDIDLPFLLTVPLWSDYEYWCICWLVTTYILSSLLLSNHKVLVKEHLVPVIQLGIEIARTRCHQILRKQWHLSECRLSKILSNSKIRHEVVEIAKKMCRHKCIWFQSSNLELKSLEQVANKILREDSHLPECRVSKTLSNSMIRHELVEIATKCVGKKASGSSHPIWKWFRENTLSPNSDETVAFAWMQTFQGTFKFQDLTWGRWDSQQNVLPKGHQVNQAAAYGFFLGGFAVPSWVLQFNTLHSYSRTNAPPVRLSQIFHRLSSPLSSEEYDNMLAVQLTAICCAVLGHFEWKESCNF